MNNLDSYRVQPQNFVINPNKKEKVKVNKGFVQFVVEKSTDKHCFLKIMRLITNETIFKQKIEILSNFHHPAIIQFIGFAVDNKNGYIYLKEAEKGSLESCLNERKIVMENGSYETDFTPLWDDTHKLIIAYGVARAIEYLHSKNILHQNLTTENILIDADLFPYITDFGISKEVDDIKSPPVVITTATRVLPPEFINDYRRDKLQSNDVYSYALVLYRLWTELQILPNQSKVKIPLQYLLNVLNPFPEGNYPGDNWRELIKMCWDEDPEKRPTFSKICNILESPEFVTSNIDVDLFEKYKQKFQVDLINEPKVDKSPDSNKDIIFGSIPGMLSYAKLCEEDSKLGSPDIFYEIAANYCHCLDTQYFYFTTDYKVYQCKDCNLTICEGCAKTCHKGHNIVEDGIRNIFECECGKNHFKNKRGKDNCSIEFVGQSKLGDSPACFQHFYKCNDCNKESDGKLICQACIDICHKNHFVEDCGVIKGYCSCGSHELDNGGRCKCSFYNKNEPGVCTCSKSKYPYMQRCFQCVTCGMVNSNDQGICKSCADECHKGHILLDRGVKRIICQCQTTNSCKLIKNDS